MADYRDQRKKKPGYIKQVTEGLKHSVADPILYNSERVFEGMLEIEEDFLPKFNYFHGFQIDVMPYMRTQVVQWMADVSDFFSFILFLKITLINNIVYNCVWSVVHDVTTKFPVFDRYIELQTLLLNN